MQHYILHYGEIALKNKNRFLFENALQNKIVRKLNEIVPCRVHKLPGRFLAEFAAAPNQKLVTDKLTQVFGLVNFIPCAKTEASLEMLKQRLALELERYKFDSFAVRAKRAEKNFPVSAQFVNEEIGRFVQEKTGAKVNLDYPQTTIHIEMFADRIFFGFEKIKGSGGLPVGIAGKVLVLLSGGIDSPVAAWRMMKRGCNVLFIHFHSAPFVQAGSEDKALELAELLNEYQDKSLFISIPFGEIQRQIVAHAPEEYRVLLYRRMMFRIAEAIAKEYQCLGLVTGEVLSQVASQTLSNLKTIESIANLPIFRPLIGMDKEEVIEQARKIGTFDVSTRPHEDCCSFMIPKHPRTHSRTEELEKMESRFDMDEWVQKGVERKKVFELGVLST